ncbi:MAG: VWA domain-containing protein [Alphaproteobacteria bacterium]|nr:VWA domain-containing protein [Alphaproteobacteria bacterium]
MPYGKNFQRLRGFLRGLVRHENGGTITTIALSAGFLVAFVGLAIDTTRGYMLKQRLAYAVDVAALAAAKSATTEDVTVIGQRYFDANFPAGYMGATNLSVTFTASPDNTQVTVTANADLPTALMTVVGFDKVDVGMETIAQRQAKGLELALALDTTGSMNGFIDDLQDATIGLLDVLYGSNDTVDNLYVALVPFNYRVNMAGYPSLLGFTPANPGMACPNPRSAPYNVTDATPSVAPFNSEYTTGSCNNSSQLRSALALTASKSTLISKINTLSHGGGTRIDGAAAWAFRNLSPDWQGLWGNPDLPLPYDEPLMEKVAIIMTDGENSNPSSANAVLADVCDNMTDAGIIVYTVQFRTNTPSLTNLLTDCATSPAHHYFASNGQLSAVFGEIASNLSNLRLIK